MSLTLGSMTWPRPDAPREAMLAVCLGSILALALLLLPLETALAVAVVGWFAILATVDVRLTVLLLIAARSTLDVTAETGLAPAGPLADFNVAAALSAMLVLVGTVHVAANRVRLSEIPLAKPFAALLAVFAVGVLYAPDPALAFQDWLRALSVFVLYLLVVDMLKDGKSERAVIAVILLSAVVPVLVGLFQVLSGDGREYASGFTRISSTFVHPSPFAIYLTMLLPLAFVSLIRAGSDLGKFGMGLLMAGMIVCLVATFTRGAWLGLIVAMLAMAVVRYRSAVPVVIGAVLLAWLLAPGVQDRFSNFSGEYSSVEWRTDQWADALHTVQSSWQLLTGAGLGAIGFHLAEEAHNDYLRVFVEGGVLGLAAFLWLYVGLIRTAMAGYRATTSALQRSVTLAFFAIVAARAVMFFSDNLIGHPALEWYFWSLSAVIVAMSARAVAEEDRSEERPAVVEVPP